jgi:Fur family ferric uptake transcriptional regulator
LPQLEACPRHRRPEAHAFFDSKSRYEVAPVNHHDHLVDIETGRVVEVRSPETEALQDVIARKHGFQSVDHRLESDAGPLERSRKTDKP